MTSSSQPDQFGSSVAQEPNVPQHKLRLVTSLLRRAVKLFVRSQLSSVQHLEVELEGSDRQLMAGSLPSVVLFGQKAVYQGLHLSEIRVEGQYIEVNLGQVLRGKSLRLLHDVFVFAALTLDEADLNASLDSPLLDDLLWQLVQSLAAYLPQVPALSQVTRSDIQSAQVRFLNQDLNLRLAFSNAALSGHTLDAQAHISLEDAHCLALRNVQVDFGTASEPALASALIPEVQIPLGMDVEIQSLAIAQTALRCQGKIRVRP